MTTTVTRTARRGSVLLRVARPALRAQVPVWAWFWALLAAVAVVFARSATRYDMGAGVWGSLDTVPRWFAFSLLVGQVAAGTAPHVANGLTRRAYTRVLALLALATGVAAALVWTLGLVVENTLTGRAVPALVPLVAEQAGAMTCYAVTGALVGAAYYRGGAWWGTVTLPLTVGPVLVTEAWTSSGWQGGVWRAVGLTPAPQALAVVLPVVVAAVLLVVVDRVLRRAPVRPASTSPG